VDDLKKLYAESEKLREMQVRFHPNKELFCEGELSREMYILLAGKVEILKDNKRIAIIDQKGSYLGELSTLLGVPRTATIRTITSCDFIVVEGEKVGDFFSGSPALGLKLAGILADRLAKMNKEHVRLERKKDLLSGKLVDALKKLKSRDQQIQKLVKRIERIHNLGS